ncbi:BRCA2-interacting transcriptional repressor EMSY-like isoform X2 [Xyrauchen texanus]|uniref:BRCA2-interacting transcriptional repressor EMSY-like isoform X2 n=1 Tax=Xyrauchen texanus TaxID=154827 RepID=UPI0022426023|nr:BRCA2-interacting transcriptional repressor EMSY-like isoform X2 [Xyrauchen texanus]
MIQQEKPLSGIMPVVWPTLLDLNRDECKRILRKLELEAYAGVVSALRAQGDLTKDKKELLGELSRVLSISTERHRAEVRRAVNDERLNTIAYHMSGPNSSSEWSIEGRRLVPLMPRLVPQTAFTVTANAVASATAHQNASLLLPAETGNKEVVVCYSYTSTTFTPPSASAPCSSSSAAAAVKLPQPASPASNVVVLPSGSTVYVKSVSCSDEDEKPRKRRRTNSSSSSPVLLKEVPKVVTPISKTITVPVSGSPKISNLMQSIANSLPPHMSPVKITFTKPSTQTTNTTTQKVIIVTTSPSSNFVPNILSKSHNYAAMSKLVSSGALTVANQRQTMVISAGSCPAPGPSPVAVTTMVSSTPSVVMSTIAQGGSSTAVKVASTRQPSPKALVGSPPQVLHIPKPHTQSQQTAAAQSVSPKAMQASPVSSTQSAGMPPGAKSTIQIKQESGVKIITQQMQPSKILPKPSSAALPSSSSAPIMVVSSNGAIMSTKLVSAPTGTQTTYTRPSVSPALAARVATSPAGATYVKTTSGSIITVVPKSLATLGGKIITSSMVSGTTTKITTIPMTSKPNVIVVQKTTGKGTTIQGLPGKNVVTTLLNAGGEKTLQAVPGVKPAIITASRPITKMIVTQPKSLSAGVQPSTTKIIPTKIVYGQQGKTQVLIKPKPMAFQTAVMSEQTRQLVTETLQQVSRSTDAGQEGAPKDDSPSYTESGPASADITHESQPVVHVITSRGQEWTGEEVSVEASPTIIYQDLMGESQSATSTIKALLELQQTSVKDKGDSKPRQHTIDLSQMAVPIPLPTERRQSPEPSNQSAAESEAVTECMPTGKAVIAAEASGSSSQNQTAVKSSAPSPSTPAHATQQEQVVLEEGGSEGDTLDPQTGLFYRSSLQPVSQAPPPLQQHRPAPPTLSKPVAGPAETATSSKRAEPATPRPSVQRERPTPSTSLSPSAGPPPSASNPPHTPQLPKLQQAPTSHNRPNTHMQLSQPPPLQAHHPVGSSKTPGSIQQPIITQGATVTKITFGGHPCPPVSSSGDASVKLQAESSSSLTASEKPSVSDILKISMMEAEIDPSAGHMLVDSSSDSGPLTKAPPTSSLISSSKQTHTHGPFGRVKSKDVDIIQVIPQYSIMPDSSQSNVVVEPSGFLEITDFTSQRLDEEAAMEQEVDSSNDEGAAASPMETCADQSQ